MKLAPCLALLLSAAAAQAQDVPVETATLGKAVVTLHAHPFLTEEELATLRLVLTNDAALLLFVPEGDGFAALAMSPDDGFIRDGKAVVSAVALAGMADAATAALEATKACDAARQGKAACVTVLEVAPAN